jgi:hypothetical protein
MALSASHQVSGTYQPSNNDNIWVVTESSTGITGNFNFKFLCDVKEHQRHFAFTLKSSHSL